MSDTNNFSELPHPLSAESAAVLLQAMASIGAIAWRWNLDDNHFFYTTELTDALGIIPSDNTGLLGLLPDDERNALYLAARHAYDSSEVLEEQVSLEVDNGVFPFRFVGSRLDCEDKSVCYMAGILMAGVDTGQLFDSILNNAQVLVFVKDLQGRYLFVNEQYANACGEKVFAFAGKTDEEIFSIQHAKSLQRLESQVISTGQPLQMEEQLSIAKNNNIYLSGRFPIANNQGRIYAIGGILTDITRQKKYESTIRFQRQELQEIIDAIPAEVLHFDTEGKILGLNKQARDILNIGQQPVKGFTLLEMFPNESQLALAHDGVLSCIKDGKPFTSVLTRRVKGHPDAWVRIEIIPLRSPKGTIDGALLVVTDISEIKENELQLASREASYSAFIANSSEAINGAELRPPMPVTLEKGKQLDWVVNHLYFAEANHIFTRLTGKPIQLLLGQRVIDLVSPVNQPQIRAYFQDVLDNGFANSRFSCQLIDPEGRALWIEISGRGRVENDHLIEIWSVFRDVTEQKQQEMALRRSELRYRNFIAKSHEGIFSLTLPEPLDTTLSKTVQVQRILQTMIVSECNSEFVRQHKRDAENSLMADLFGDALALKLVSKLIDNQYEMPEMEVEVINAKDESRWYLVHLDGVIDGDYLTGCWGISRDITDRHQYLNELEFQANHDSLTMLPNRKALYAEIVTRLKDLDDQSKHCVALMLIDLDRFKEINDTLGHHMGDKLLKLLGPRLQSVIAGGEGLVARLGGDEFAIVIAQVTEAEALDKAFQVLLAIRGTFDLDGFKADISASIGLSFAPKHGRDVGVLMRYADVAMYRAKTESVGVLEYDASFDEHTPKRLSLITDLGRAIREQQLHLVFQPKIDLKNKCLKGVEALLRWQHPVHGRVPPAEFIPLAETTELIRPLTLWVLDTALAQCSRWRKQGLDIGVAINLSARNLHDVEIVRQVTEALQSHHLPPECLELEITESAIMADPKRALSALKELDELGVYLSIDDFGTGYSSLAYLKKLPVDLLKIDASFVTDMLADEQDAIIVNSTINLAHNLGLEVIAEGVETESTLLQLHGMGCDHAQGYFIARPMAYAEFSSWLAKTSWQPRRLQ